MRFTAKFPYYPKWWQEIEICILINVKNIISNLSFLTVFFRPKRSYTQRRNYGRPAKPGQIGQKTCRKQARKPQENGMGFLLNFWRYYCKNEKRNCFGVISGKISGVIISFELLEKRNSSNKNPSFELVCMPLYPCFAKNKSICSYCLLTILIALPSLHFYDRPLY